MGKGIKAVGVVGVIDHCHHWSSSSPAETLARHQLQQPNNARKNIRVLKTHTDPHLSISTQSGTYSIYYYYS